MTTETSRRFASSGKRVVDVVAAKSRLDVPYGNLAVVGSESRAESRGGVALDQDDVGLEAKAGVFHRIDHAAGEHAQGLVRTHDVQVEVRLDLEVLEHLIEHRAMLTRVHHGRFEFSRSAAQIVDHEGELDGLRPRA